MLKFFNLIFLFIFLIINIFCLSDKAIAGIDFATHELFEKIKKGDGESIIKYSKYVMANDERYRRNINSAFITDVSYKYIYGISHLRNSLNKFYKKGNNNLKPYLGAINYISLDSKKNKLDIEQETQNLLTTSDVSKYPFVSYFLGLASEDCQKSKEYFESASREEGYARAYTALASIYMSGKCETKDEAKAIALLNKAAKAGDGVAYLLIGNYYISDDKYDSDKALNAFLKYNDYLETRKFEPFEKYPKEYYRILGNAFASGNNTKVDKQKALKYYGNYSCASYKVDFKNVLNATDLGKISKENKEILSKADAGDHEAQYKIAIAYATGVGVLPDCNQAKKYWELSANQNYAPAMYDYSYFSDDEYFWIEKAANANEGRALYRLYRHTNDETYLNKAISLENPEALLFKARKLNKERKCYDINPESIEMAKKAANLGNVHAWNG